MFGTDGKVLNWSLKKQILTVVLQNCKKSAVKHSINKPIFFNFVDLSTIFCPRLSEETYFHLQLGLGPMEFTFLIYFSISKYLFTLKTHI